MKVIRANGDIEHHTSFSRPRPFWNLKAWRWLAARYFEYRKMAKNDGC
jgi:hypothetical protein